MKSRYSTLCPLGFQSFDLSFDFWFCSFFKHFQRAFMDNKSREVLHKLHELDVVYVTLVVKNE